MLNPRALPLRLPRAGLEPRLPLIMSETLLALLPSLTSSRDLPLEARARSMTAWISGILARICDTQLLRQCMTKAMMQLQHAVVHELGELVTTDVPRTQQRQN